MWLYMIYCVAAVLNGCQGAYYTEGAPMISTSQESQEKCQTAAIRSAKALKAEKPSLTIMWKCVDYSDVQVIEDKRIK